MVGRTRDVDLGAHGQQVADNIDAVALRCDVEWRELVLESAFNIRAVLYQGAADIHVAFLRGHVQRRADLFVLKVDSALALCEKKLYHFPKAIQSNLIFFGDNEDLLPSVAATWIGTRSV